MSISKKQWLNIMLDMLGLRSGATADDIQSAASYAMNCGQVVKSIQQVPAIPDSWDNLLVGTLKTMQGFEGYKIRYLLIVSPSSSNNFEYGGTFPKCSSKPTKVLASVKLDNDVGYLANWVVSNIPG